MNIISMIRDVMQASFHAGRQSMREELCDGLTDDQVNYLHELAEERRAIWRAHAALTAADRTET